GIAMAIPMDVVQPIVNSLIQYGKVTRPKLGISVMTLRGSEEPTEGRIPAGVYVSAVTEGGPAAQAGIQADDIIIRVDGERITLHTDLTNRIATKTPGESVTLTIYRIPHLAELTVQDRVPKGEEIEVTVELQLPAENT
ncbi:MAG: PDZ domain-containing protein, partial [Clostridia bacterium]|nr:PDZ domain-containing protein [Clostridia bacterium]